VATYINYFGVASLRGAPFEKKARKGASEGSEVAIAWDAIFSTRNGAVESIADGKIRVCAPGGIPYTWQNAKKLAPRVAVGAGVSEQQIIASVAEPVVGAALDCVGTLPANYITNLLESPERTQRFTGVKLARLRGEQQYAEKIRSVGQHPDEDLYVQLEAAAYLVSVCGEEAKALFGPFLDAGDEQARLEAVVALAAAATPDAVEVLGAILLDDGEKYYLRSAAAWGLGQVGDPSSVNWLVAAFGEAERAIKEDALEAVATLEHKPFARLTDVVLDTDELLAAGAAEALRRYAIVPQAEFERLIAALKGGNEQEWVVWLVANLPRGIDYVDTAVADLQNSQPRAHFAISVLWAFLRSWIAPSWELNPNPEPLRPL
jgi:hypothetical protein